MSRTTKMPCPVTGCQEILKTKEAWIEHFKDKHPEIEMLNIGGEKINLKEE